MKNKSETLNPYIRMSQGLPIKYHVHTWRDDLWVIPGRILEAVIVLFGLALTGAGAYLAYLVFADLAGYAAGYETGLLAGMWHYAQLPGYFDWMYLGIALGLVSAGLAILREMVTIILNIVSDKELEALAEWNNKIESVSKKAACECGRCRQPFSPRRDGDSLCDKCLEKEWGFLSRVPRGHT